MIITGCSGSGKSTLISHLMQAHPTRFGFSISNTTRAPRGKEVSGVDYNFMTPDEFKLASE
jgi:guanylate kinase